MFYFYHLKVLSVVMQKCATMKTFIENGVDQTPWYFKGEIDYIDNWFLMRTPGPVLAILVAYLVFVLKLGPAFMEKRPAFQLKTTLIIYNITQVFYSLFVCWVGCCIIFKYGLVSRKCMMNVPEARLTATSAFYLYLIAKFSELLDTVFFVLRKKTNQVTFLHVYHHTMIVTATWGMLKYDPTFVTVLIGTLNSFVHIIMYTYYGLSAFPRLNKYLWWKKYLTAFQLIQFEVMIIHAVVTTAISECPPSYILLFTIFFNVFLMIYLFSDFYFTSYTKKHNDVNEKNKDISIKGNLKYSKGNDPYLAKANSNDVSNWDSKVD